MNNALYNKGGMKSSKRIKGRNASKKVGDHCVRWISSTHDIKKIIKKKMIFLKKIMIFINPGIFKHWRIQTRRSWEGGAVK